METAAGAASRTAAGRAGHGTGVGTGVPNDDGADTGVGAGSDVNTRGTNRAKPHSDTFSTLKYHDQHVYGFRPGL